MFQVWRTGYLKQFDTDIAHLKQEDWYEEAGHAPGQQEAGVILQHVAEVRFFLVEEMGGHWTMNVSSSIKCDIRNFLVVQCSHNYCF